MDNKIVTWYYSHHSQGSGSNVDLCVITADKTEYFRQFDEAAKKGPRSGEYHYKRGTTAVLETSVRKFEITSESVTRVESMET